MRANQPQTFAETEIAYALNFGKLVAVRRNESERERERKFGSEPARVVGFVCERGSERKCALESAAGRRATATVRIRAHDSIRRHTDRPPVALRFG